MSADDGAGGAAQVELLSAWFCPYAQRARIALEEKCKGSFAVIESVRRSPPSTLEKSSALFERNPRGLVPVLIDRRGGEEVVVCESLICVEYIDEAMGAGPTLLPGSPSQRAHARMWADKLNGGVCAEFFRMVRGQDWGGRERAAARLLDGLREFGQQCEGPFFYGEDFSIVDIAVAPWAAGMHMDVIRHYRGFEVPRTEEFAKYWAWVAAVQRRPSFVATAPDDLPSLIDLHLPFVEGKGYSSIIV